MFCKLPLSAASVLLAGSLMSLQCQSPTSVGLPTARLADGLAVIESSSFSNVSTASGVGSSVQSPAQLHLALAQSDTLGLLETALARWQTVDSYRLTLSSQERIGGKLGRLSVIEARLLRQPYSVSFRWVENAGRVDKLLWQPDVHSGKLVVRPTGVVGRLLTAVRVDPDSDTVRSATRRSVTRFGLANVLQEVLDDYRENRQSGSMTVEAAALVCRDSTEPNALLLRRTTTDTANESRTMLLWLDATSLRPLQVQQFGWDDELLGSYSFNDYEPLELTREDFTLAALGFE